MASLFITSALFRPIRLRNNQIQVVAVPPHFGMQQLNDIVNCVWSRHDLLQMVCHVDGGHYMQYRSTKPLELTTCEDVHEQFIERLRSKHDTSRYPSNFEIDIFIEMPLKIGRTVDQTGQPYLVLVLNHYAVNGRSAEVLQAELVQVVQNAALRVDLETGLDLPARLTDILSFDAQETEERRAERATRYATDLLSTIQNVHATRLRRVGTINTEFVQATATAEGLREEIDQAVRITSATPTAVVLAVASIALEPVLGRNPLVWDVLYDRRRPGIAGRAVEPAFGHALCPFYRAGPGDLASTIRDASDLLIRSMHRGVDYLQFLDAVAEQQMLRRTRIDPFPLVNCMLAAAPHGEDWAVESSTSRGLGSRSTEVKTLNYNQTARGGVVNLTARHYADGTWLDLLIDRKMLGDDCPEALLHRIMDLIEASTGNRDARILDSGEVASDVGFVCDDWVQSDEHTWVSREATKQALDLLSSPAEAKQGMGTDNSDSYWSVAPWEVFDCLRFPGATTNLSSVRLASGAHKPARDATAPSAAEQAMLDAVGNVLRLNRVESRDSFVGMGGRAADVPAVYYWLEQTNWTLPSRWDLLDACPLATVARRLVLCEPFVG